MRKPLSLNNICIDSTIEAAIIFNLSILLLVLIQ